METIAGRKLQGGKYTLETELGRGGFGVTYKAIHHFLHHVVVIKTINEALRQDPNFADYQRKFREEARRLAMCVHPNIVRVSDFFVEGGQPFMVMDYIPGPTLDVVVFPNRPLPEAIAVHYIRQIGSALSLVHRRGLLHRDIKPQNIILRQETQEVVLIDFGIAREFQPGVTQTHTSLISEGYAPIEQYLPQEKRTPATDVYGLAATLYTLLTARVPVPAVLRERQSLPTPRSLQPALSAQVDQAVMRGMALEVRDRPVSMMAWLSLLPEAEPVGQVPTAAARSGIEPRVTSATVPLLLQQSQVQRRGVTPLQTKRSRGVQLLYAMLIWGTAVTAAILTVIAVPLLLRPSPESDPTNSPDTLKTETAGQQNVEDESEQETESSAESQTPDSERSQQTQTTELPDIIIPDASGPRAEAGSSEKPTGRDKPGKKSKSKKTEDRPPVIVPSTGNVESPVQGGNTGSSASVNRVPGFAPGTSKDEVASTLGQPTKTGSGYWPNTRSALYEVAPNKVTLGYLYDQQSDRLRQTEVSFAQSVDPLIMQVTLNGMLGSVAPENVLEGLTQVRQRQTNQHTFRVGDLEGVIERNEHDRIYIGVWEDDLH